MFFVSGIVMKGFDFLGEWENWGMEMELVDFGVF